MSVPVIVHGVVGLDTLETPGGRAECVLGGSAPYAALGARLFADEVALLGIVGDDFPAAHEEALAACGIGLDCLDHAPGPTFAWEARYAENMNCRTTLDTRLGVLENWRLDLPAAFRSKTMVLATNVTPSQQLEFLEQCERPAFVMADFMESWIVTRRAEVERVMEKTDLVLMNDEEARAFTGETETVAAAEAILAAGPRYAVVKQGSCGATLAHRAPGGELCLFRCPAWPLKRPVDPTGAGDTFMGALGGYLAHSMPTCSSAPGWQEMKRGMAAAAVAAAVACESFGTDALLAVTRAEIRRRLEAFASMTCWTLPEEGCIVTR